MMKTPLLTPCEGILLLDKPSGKTSFFLVHLLRKLTRVRKIGHTGTLDPLATGVMVMLVGKKYTRLAEKLQGHDKEYVVTIELGKISDTYDIDGSVQQTTTPFTLKPSQKDLEKALESFQGTIEQIPPMFSAKKIGGKKLYELARKGLEIERPAISVKVKTTLKHYEYPYVTLHIACSSGTYVRSIGHDLGQMLKTGAIVTKLSRIRSGPFTIDECISVEKLSERDDYQNLLIHSLEGVL